MLPGSVFIFIFIFFKKERKENEYSLLQNLLLFVFRLTSPFYRLFSVTPFGLSPWLPDWLSPFLTLAFRPTTLLQLILAPRYFFPSPIIPLPLLVSPPSNYSTNLTTYFILVCHYNPLSLFHPSLFPSFLVWYPLFHPLCVSFPPLIIPVPLTIPSFPCYIPLSSPLASPCYIPLSIPPSTPCASFPPY